MAWLWSPFLSTLSLPNWRCAHIVAQTSPLRASAHPVHHRFNLLQRTCYGAHLWQCHHIITFPITLLALKPGFFHKVYSKIPAATSGMAIWGDRKPESARIIPSPPCLWASPRHWTGLDVRKVRSRKRCGLTNGSSKHQRCFYPWKTKLALSEASLARTPIKNTNFNTNTMNYKDIYPRIGVLLHSSHGITCEGPSDLH